VETKMYILQYIQAWWRHRCTLHVTTVYFIELLRKLNVLTTVLLYCMVRSSIKARAPAS